MPKPARGAGGARRLPKREREERVHFASREVLNPLRLDLAQLGAAGATLLHYPPTAFGNIIGNSGLEIAYIKKED